MTALGQDLRYGIRQLRKSPGFTAVAVITLALSIGANTAVFSLIDAIMLRMLPVNDPQQLVIVTWAAERPAHAEKGEFFWPGCPAEPLTACSFSTPMFQQFSAEQKSFSGLFAFFPSRLTINAHGNTRSVYGLYVSGEFFPTLGVRAELGRVLTRSDDSRGAAPAVVVSDRFWRSALAGDHQAIGKSISIGKMPFTIVGVAPPIDLDPGVPRDVWLPLSFREIIAPDLPNPTAANAIGLQMMGRLKPGVEPSVAASSLSRIFTANATTGPEAIFSPSDGPHIDLPTMAHGLVTLRQAFSRPLYILFSVVGLVLLIACANMAGLMLARSSARRKEIAMRNALGASRSRIVRQLFTESILLSTAGGAVGIVLGLRGAAALSAFFAPNWYMPIALELHADMRVLIFTAVISTTVGLAFGCAPAFSSSKLELVQSLRDDSSWQVAGLKFGGTLVAVQIALATLVLAGAGLLVRTLVNLSSVDPGFDPHNLLLFGVDATYANGDNGKLDTLHRNLQKQLATLPGVTSVSYSEVPLLSGGGVQTFVFPENQPQTTVDLLHISPDFLRTMRFRLIAGRPLGEHDFQHTRSDRAGEYQPVVINKALARLLFGDRNPLGLHFRSGTPDSPLSEVVGVVDNAKYDTLRGEVMPTIYSGIGTEQATFEIRTALDPKTLMPAVHELIRRFDRNLFLTDLKTQVDEIDENTYQERLVATLSSILAALALLVACVGIYGLLSYQVTRRTRDIGIRMAFGARPGDILRLVLQQAIALTAIGALIGVVASLVLTRYLQTFLFGVKPSDPVTFLAVPTTLAATAVLASFVPARRAAKVDPMVALRHE